MTKVTILKNVSRILLTTSTVILALLWGRVSHSQTQYCGSYEYERESRERGILPSIQEQEETIRNLIISKARSRKNTTPPKVRVIPVIFHVLHENDPLNTHDNLDARYIHAQIKQLNDDFRKKAGTLGYNTHKDGADTYIEFALSPFDPDGNLLSEPGIERINVSGKGWGSPPFDYPTSSFSTGIMEDEIKPSTYWDPNKYMNIWVADISAGSNTTLMGIAPFPSLSTLDDLRANSFNAENDGVTLNRGGVGGNDYKNGSARSSKNLGRTGTHEIGHWLGLRHIWGDGDCYDDDYCDDTPKSDTHNLHCGNYTHCGSRDMVENYMDYTPDLCMNIFTHDQKARMDVVLENSPRRKTLLTTIFHSFFKKLIISEIVNGDESENTPNYIELFNASDKTVVTKDLEIRIFENGNQTPKVIAIPDNISILSKQTYVMARTAFNTAWGGAFATETPDLISPQLDFNGNDAIALYDQKWERELDVFGKIGENGTGKDWEYHHKIATRNFYIKDVNANDFKTQDFAFKNYESKLCTPGSHENYDLTYDWSITQIIGITENQKFASCSHSTTLTPQVEIKNEISEDLSVVSFQVNLNGTLSKWSKTLSTPLQKGQKTTLTLDPIIITENTNKLRVSVDDAKDQILSNNSVEVNFQMVSQNLPKDYHDMTFKFYTDENQKTDNYWILYDENNKVVKSTALGDHTQSSMKYEYNWCLKKGKYRLHIVDKGVNDAVNRANKGIFPDHDFIAEMIVNNEVVKEIDGHDLHQNGTTDIEFLIPHWPYDASHFTLNLKIDFNLVESYVEWDIKDKNDQLLYLNNFIEYDKYFRDDWINHTLYLDSGLYKLSVRNKYTESSPGATITLQDKVLLEIPKYEGGNPSNVWSEKTLEFCVGNEPKTIAHFKGFFNSPSTISLSWEATETTQYELLKSTSGDKNSYLSFQKIDKSTTHFIDNINTSESDYYYGIVNHLGCLTSDTVFIHLQTSDASSKLDEPQNYPTDWVGTATEQSIELNWTHSVGSPLPQGYLIYAQETNNTLPTPIDGRIPTEDWDLSDGHAVAIVAYPKSTLTFQNLKPNTLYYFQIWPFTQKNTLGNFKTTPTNNFLSLTTKPILPPTHYPYLIDGQPTETTLKLTWQQPTGGKDPTGYLLTASQDKSKLKTPLDGEHPDIDENLSDGYAQVLVNFQQKNSHTFENLKPDTEYHFQWWPYVLEKNIVKYKTSPTNTFHSFKTLAFQSIEPDHYPTNLTGFATQNSLTIKWEMTKSNAMPTGFLLVIGQKKEDLKTPKDGFIMYSDRNERLNTQAIYIENFMTSGKGEYTFNSLFPNTPYYLQVWPFRGEGSQINYKTTPENTLYIFTTRLNEILATQINENPILIFPNPVHDQLYVKAQNTLSPNFELVDMAGKKLNVNVGFSHPHYVFDLNSIKSGNYILLLYDQKNTYRYLIRKF